MDGAINSLECGLDAAFYGGGLTPPVPMDIQLQKKALRQVAADQSADRSAHSKETSPGYR
jgi:hypothetical protein